MCVDLSDAIFNDENKAREHLEAIRWPDGPYCPHCGEVEKVYRLHGKSHRPGLIHCNSCEQAFTVTVGSVMERSHVPLNKWVLAYRLVCSSKKGMSAHQLHRMLNVTYKTAWFMALRIRESVTAAAPSAIGGSNKVVEADETYVGGKAKDRAYEPEPKKQIVMTLVERGGKARSFHVKNATAKTLRETAVKIASRKSYLMTDENAAYTKLGKELSGHGTVNHSADEYVRMGGFVHVNTAENISRNLISVTTIAQGWGSSMPSARKRPSVARRPKGSIIKHLVKPRTLKQKAKALLRWRKKYGR